jgi:hypothetical protein
LLAFAYFCIGSTPFQIAIVLWALGLAITTDATVMSLTNKVFLSSYLPPLYALVKLVLSFFPASLADFIWALPITFHAALKAVTSTALGLWLLPIARDMEPGGGAHHLV